MAAPGVGVGDIINGCLLIYKLCVKYKDAPKEFDEIAEKSRSLTVVLERIDGEALIGGNLVERAGPQAYDQLQDNLASLRRDSEKLQAIVKKYDKIHKEGPGRRLLFAVMESNGLTDLRQRIGRHEQTLQLWYMTLVYGSLRRLETAQDVAAKRLEAVMTGIEAIKRLGRQREDRIRESLAKGDTIPLERELERSGLSKEAVCTSLNASANYVMISPREQNRMETEIREDLDDLRKESVVGRTGRESFASPSRVQFEGTLPNRAKHSSSKQRSDAVYISKPSPSHLDQVPAPPLSTVPAPPLSTMVSQPLPEEVEKHFKRFKESTLPFTYESSTVRPGRSALRPNAPRMRRSNSTSARKDYPDPPVVVIGESSTPRDQVRYLSSQQSKHPRIRSGYPSVHQKEDVIIMPNDSSRRARRRSEVPAPRNEAEPRAPRTPLLVVPDPGPKYRSSSAEGRNETHRPAVEEIIIERRPRSASKSSDRDESGQKRSSSSHSYVRVRSNSRDGGNNDESERVRMVRKMDRIDSMGT